MGEVDDPGAAWHGPGRRGPVGQGQRATRRHAPRTRSGKIVELAVRDAVHGRPVENREALTTPAALALFAGRPELVAD